MAMEQRRMTPPRNSLSAGVSGAALNPAKEKTVIPAQEIITLRTVPEKTPSNKIHHRRMEKPALMRERQTERSRTIITCLPLKTRQASTTTNLSCRRIPSKKSVSNAGSWPRRTASRKKQQQLRADQDLLADRWTEILAAEEYELEC